MAQTSGLDFAAVVDRIVDHVQDYAIVVMSPDGTLRSWNAGAQRLHGYTTEEAVGRHLSVLFTADDRAAGVPERLLDQALASGNTEHSGWRVRQDGTWFWGDGIAIGLHGDDGRPEGVAMLTRDSTAQHRLEERLRDSEERLRILIGQVVDYAIIMLDPVGTIVSWNAGAERLQGYSEPDALGHHFSVFYTEEDRLAGLPQRLLGQAREDGRVENTGWRVRQDGTTFWADVVITALYDDHGRHTGFAKVTRDLSERRRLEEAQESFFAAFNHDFRTPMLALRGFAELAQQTEGADQQMALDRVRANAERLGQMAEGLAAYAQMRASSHAAEPVDVRLDQLARDCVDDLASLLEASRVTVMPSPLEAVVDPAALQRVLTNLLTNALKYSGSGPVLVAFGEAGPGRVQLQVADQGRGIDPDDLPTIFEEFERGRLAQPDGGSGLGLASVRKLVTEQGGEVRIESTVGAGTVVTVELPGPGS